MQKRIIIVNERDEVIDHKSIEKIKPEDIYRVAALWIKNSEGNILLAKRAKNKKHDPGKWGPAVAGTVEQDEKYEENIRKEAKEELNLNSNFKLKKGPLIRIHGKHNFFCKWFVHKADLKIEDLKINKEEVEEIKWFKFDDLLRKIDSEPDKFIESMRGHVEIFRHI